MARIVYGLPTAELGARASDPRSGIILGGCVVEPDSPTYTCRACGVAWPSPCAALQARYPLPLLRWPTRLPQGLGVERLRDLARGALLWGAVGDALGRANEGRSISTVGQEHDPDFVRTFRPSPGWQGGPTGTITDDTQLTMIVAGALLAGEGRIDPESLSGRLADWLPTGWGKGRATTEAVTALAEGRPWWEVGPMVDSAGNGAAMRVAPVALAHALDPAPGPLLRIAVTSALPTHAAPVGVAGAVAIAAGVGATLRATLGGSAFDPAAFVNFVVQAISRLETEPSPERKPPHTAVYLRDRLAELPDLLARDPAEVLAYTWTGAFALESVPAAFFCFLRAPDDPAAAILTAANTSHDTDTIASMAGQLVGARVGAERLRREHPEWWGELEFRDELIGLADQLIELRQA